MTITTMTREQYDAADGENWSRLKELARNPAAYAWRAAHPRGDTDAMRLGRCVHLAVLEPERFASEIAIWDGGRRYGKEWTAFKAEHASKEILKRDEFRLCMALQSAVRSDPVAAPYLMRGQAEQTVQWVDRVTGLHCKGRVDWLSGLNCALADLKTTRDASPAGFARESWTYRYHSQLAYYVDGLQAAENDEGPRPAVIIAVESAPPHPVVVYRVPESVLEHGREEYRELLSRLKGLRELGPDAFATGYATCELDLELPRWMQPRADDDIGGLGLDFSGTNADGSSESEVG